MRSPWQDPVRGIIRKETDMASLGEIFLRDTRTQAQMDALLQD